MGKQNSMRRLAVAVAGAVLAIAGSTQAHFTTINPPAPGEMTQAQILSHTYGGTFTQHGLNMSNGQVKAVRMDDCKDETFNFDIQSVRTIGTFSGSCQGLAYGSVDSHTALFDASGNGCEAIGKSGPIEMTTPYSFVRTGYGHAYSSDDSQNVDGHDHMVTYLLQGKGVKHPTYVMFFEDASVQHRGCCRRPQASLAVGVSEPSNDQQ